MLDELEPGVLHDVLGHLVRQALLPGDGPEQGCHLVDEGRHPGRLAVTVAAERVGRAEPARLSAPDRVHHGVSPTTSATAAETCLTRSSRSSSGDGAASEPGGDLADAAGAREGRAAPDAEPAGVAVGVGVPRAGSEPVQRATATSPRSDPWRVTGIVLTTATPAL